MRDRESAWQAFVEQYEIEVPEEKVENEIQYIILEMKHRMQYDTLTSGALHLNARTETEEQMEDICKAAFFEAKSDLVMKDIIARQSFPVTQEELETEAAAMAQRQGTTVEMLKSFFGEELAMLARDVRERKAMDWACAQLQ